MQSALSILLCRRSEAAGRYAPVTLLTGPCLPGPGKGKTPFHLQLTGGEPTLVPHLITTAVQTALATGQLHWHGHPDQRHLPDPGDLLDTLPTARHFRWASALTVPPAIQNALRGNAPKTLEGLQMLEAAKIPFNMSPQCLPTTNADASGPSGPDAGRLFHGAGHRPGPAGGQRPGNGPFDKHTSFRHPHLLEDAIHRMLKAVLDTVNSIPARAHPAERAGQTLCLPNRIIAS